MFAIDGLDESYNTCLLPMITKFSALMLKLYGHYKKGLLPFRGGAMEQPNCYLDAMQVIETWLAKIEAKHYEEARRRR